MKIRKVKFGPWSEHQLSFHTEDTDQILFELLLKEKNIPYQKSAYNSLISYTVFYFQRKDFRTAQKAYKSLKSKPSKSFVKRRYWIPLALILFMICCFLVILCIKWIQEKAL